MARRGFGGTALRAALGAVTGVAEGMRLREEREFEREKEKAAAARQAMLDTVSLVQAGAMPSAQRRVVAQQGASAIGSALASAMNVAGGGSALPFDAGAIQRSAGRLGAPAAQMTLGGTTYDIPSMQDREAMALAGALSRKRAEMGLETEQRLGLAQEQARASAAAEQQQIDAYIAAGATPAQARAAVKAKAGYGDVFVTPGQQLTATTTRRGQDITARGQTLSYMAAMGRPTGGKAGAQAEGGVVLPSITEAINNFKSITPDQLRKISSYGVSAASTGQQQGGFAELGLTGAGSLLGVIGDAEKRYAQQAGAIADAVARASEVGVLTNFDINRFRSQILFSPGDSEKIKQEKLARAVAWGEWMASNKKAVESGQFDRITATPESTAQYQISPRKPGESVEAYLARTGG